MMEQMTWKEVYELWKRQSLCKTVELNKPLLAEKIHIPCYQKGCYIYGYDWLETADAQRRKEILTNNPVNFIFMDAGNKGTIQTAEMLISAEDEEERAAIWIAATTFEIASNYSAPLSKYALQMFYAARSFLCERYYLWHHAMKKLVPEIMLPRQIMKKLTNIDASLVMDLIQVNTLLLTGHYTILLYSSLNEGEYPENPRTHRK